MEISPIRPVIEIIKSNNNKKKEFEQQNSRKNQGDSENLQNNDQPKEPGKGDYIDIKI